MKEQVAERTAAAAAYLAENSGSGLTKADVDYRMWEREQAERMGLDPDTYAGPVLFTDEEWEAMTGTREARIMFGYELPCGCRPGSCSSEYGGDCGNMEYWEDYGQEDHPDSNEYWGHPADDPSGPGFGTYSSQEDMDNHLGLLKNNFQKFEENLLHQGFDPIAHAADPLHDMHQAFPIDYAGGPAKIVKQMDTFVSGADRLLTDVKWLNNPAYHDLWVAHQTALRISRMVKTTFPDAFRVDDPWDPPF